MPSKEFLRPRLRGRRFDDGGIPLEFLERFSGTCGKMVLDVAKWRFLQSQSANVAAFSTRLCERRPLENYWTRRRQQRHACDKPYRPRNRPSLMLISQASKSILMMPSSICINSINALNAPEESIRSAGNGTHCPGKYFRLLRQNRTELAGWRSH